MWTANKRLLALWGDSRRGRRALTVGTLSGALFFLLANPPVNAQTAASPAGTPATKTMEQVYKNIRVLRGFPADQLHPTMDLISASLGVSCEHCHVRGDFSSDNKRAKRTARQMIRMVLSINRTDFHGEQAVTCYSCHRGQHDPVKIPPIAAASPEFRRGPGGPPPGGRRPPMNGRPRMGRPFQPGGQGMMGRRLSRSESAPQPGPNEILAAYVHALGGAPALAKITSRVEKGTTKMFGRQFSVEVYAKAPDQVATVTESPRGANVTSYNGQSGWSTFGGRPARFLEGADLEGAKLDAQLAFSTNLKHLFRRFRTGRPAEVDHKPARVLLGLNPGQPPVRLYFDEKTGLLVRQVRYAATPVGPYPTQIDYSDYREADGVKVPFRRTVANPGRQTTLQLSQVKVNVPIPESRFVAPHRSAQGRAVR